jgi:hypothetical protein
MGPAPQKVKEINFLYPSLMLAVQPDTDPLRMANSLPTGSQWHAKQTMTLNAANAKKRVLRKRLTGSAPNRRNPTNVKTSQSKVNPSKNALQNSRVLRLQKRYFTSYLAFVDASRRPVQPRENLKKMLHKDQIAAIRSQRIHQSGDARIPAK